MFEKVLKGGRLVDGTGAAGFVADLAMERGKIVAIGQNLQGQEELSVAGYTVTPGFLDMVALQFPEFWETKVAANPEKAEFLLPVSVDKLLKAGKLTVKMLKSADKWYGVTYAADKPVVVAALADLTKQGKYPDGLWK